MTENKRFTMDDESDIIEFDWNTNEYIDDFMWGDGKSWDRLCNRLNELYDENEELKQQKPFLKIIDDYFIQYEDGELFNLHKPSDIRSLMYILNRENGYGELECEYNDFIDNWCFKGGNGLYCFDKGYDEDYAKRRILND